MSDDHGGSSPWGEVSKLQDVLVAFVDLPSGRGAWEPEHRVILLQRGMSRAETRCTLMHELEHARRGDEAVDDVSQVMATRQEIAAETRAARRLIPFDRLVEALKWSQDDWELAEELNVTVEIVRHRLMTLSTAEHLLIEQRLWLWERHKQDEEESA